MVTFENTPQDASLRSQHNAERQKQAFKQYQVVRYFMRDIDALGDNVNSIADMRRLLDAFIAEYGNGNYSRNLESYLAEAVQNANDRAGYNADGTPKQKLRMGGKTYFVQLGDWYYGEMHNITEYSVTLSDSVSGKSWHWQIVAWIERETPNAAYGRMWRTIFLNGAFYQESNYGFGARLNPMMPTYSDPRQVILSFLSEAERLTKQMNQE